MSPRELRHVLAVFATPLKEIRPADDLVLKTPWNEAGIDTEPPMSLCQMRCLLELASPLRLGHCYQSASMILQKMLQLAYF